MWSRASYSINSNKMKCKEEPETPAQSLHEAIIELYLNVKIRNTEEVGVG